jgi:S-formylglutathione hydrolase FrmB
MRYRLLLPRNYGNGGRFPVLYLLHGVYGDYKNWDTRTGLENYAKDLDVLIVMPDADDSWYTNSAMIPADKFEDYIAKELIAEVDEKYRTIHDGHARAIAGLSMGGYGAIKLALKYPELFAVAGILSGAFNAPGNLDALRPECFARTYWKYSAAKLARHGRKRHLCLVECTTPGSLSLSLLGVRQLRFLPRNQPRIRSATLNPKS